jgi:hypothetical protein
MQSPDADAGQQQWQPLLLTRPVPAIVAGVVLQLVLVAAVVGSFAVTAASGRNPVIHFLSGPQPPQGYLESAPSEVDFYQWTTDGKGDLTGDFFMSLVTDDYGNVQSFTIALTGTIHGSAVTLTLPGNPSSLFTYTGTVTGDALTLMPIIHSANGCSFQDTLHRATIHTYNTEVDALRQRAAQGQPRFYLHVCSIDSSTAHVAWPSHVAHAPRSQIPL